MKKIINDERIRIIIATKYNAAKCAAEVSDCINDLFNRIQTVSPEILQEKNVFSPFCGMDLNDQSVMEQWEYEKKEWLTKQVPIIIGDQNCVTKERYGHNPDFLIGITSEKPIPESSRIGFWEVCIIMRNELYNSIGEKEVNQWSNDISRAMRATVGYIERVNKVSRYYIRSGIHGICRGGYDIFDVGKNLERELPGALWRMLCTSKHIEILGGIEKMKETLPVYRIDETEIAGEKGAWIQLTEDIFKVNDEQRLNLRMQIEELLPKINIALAARNKKKGGYLADYPVYTEEEKKLIREYIKNNK